MLKSFSLIIIMTKEHFKTLEVAVWGKNKVEQQSNFQFAALVLEFTSLLLRLKTHTHTLFLY